jgi:general secretion pathway protein J
MSGHPKQPGTGGFTLIELLVAIALMALMAVLSWRGLDGISRTRTQLQQRADAVLTLQATLAQWAADMDAMSAQPGHSGLDWDGRVLRILRRSSVDAADGLHVVAWARRSEAGQGQWLRWQSPAFQDRTALDLAWQKAALWAQTPSDEDRLREVRTIAMEGWQVFYFRENAWSNPLSSVGGSVSGASATLPDGVRLVLQLPPGPGIGGVLTRDWVQPLLGGGK